MHKGQVDVLKMFVWNLRKFVGGFLTSLSQIANQMHFAQNHKHYQEQEQESAVSQQDLVTLVLALPHVNLVLLAVLIKFVPLLSPFPLLNTTLVSLVIIISSVSTKALTVVVTLKTFVVLVHANISKMATIVMAITNAIILLLIAEERICVRNT